MIKLKDILTEKTVRLSTMKDANFQPGQFVQLMGKKGMVKLDKKSVHKLAKIVRQLSGKKGMGWSFTMGEGKLTERVNHSLVKKMIKAVDKGEDVVVYDKKGKRYTFQGGDNKYVSVTDHWKDGGNESSWKDIPHKDIKKIVIEGKLNEGKTITLPNGIKVKIDFKGLTFIGGTKPVFLDRTEMMTFFKATARYLK